MKYQRARAEGGTYFFTVVTHRRREFLCESENVSILREAFRYVIVRHPFKIDAFVLLPDHLHCIWTLPEGDCDFSTRWRLIKSAFTRACGEACHGSISSSRQRKGERAIWQRRFWEHSSFHRYVRKGFYDQEWGAEGMVSFEASVGAE